MAANRVRVSCYLSLGRYRNSSGGAGLRTVINNGGPASVKSYFAMLSLSAALCAAQLSAQSASGANCSFLAHRDDFLSSQLRARQGVVARVSQATAFTKLVHPG